MQEMKLPSIEELCQESEYTSVHYFCHLMHSLGIIGYNCPNKEISKTAKNYYFGLVKALHLNPENKEQLNKRLSDMV